MINGIEDNNLHKHKILYGAIKVGNNVFIGSRTIILPETRIGNNVIIGAGSIVKGNIESNGIYAGIPAKRIGNFDDFIHSRKTFSYENEKINTFEYAWESFKNKFDMNGESEK